MKTTTILGAKLSANRCPERGCVVRDQPQDLAKVWLSGIFHALRLVFDTAALLSVLIAASLLLLCPASAQAQGGVPLWTNRFDRGIGDDSGGSIAVDGSGNVFVTGYSYNGSFNDAATVAYSSAGVPPVDELPSDSERLQCWVSSGQSRKCFRNGERGNGQIFQHGCTALDQRI